MLQEEIPEYIARDIELLLKAEHRPIEEGYEAYDHAWEVLCADVNVAFRNNMISEELAWELREEYLGMKRNS